MSNTIRHATNEDLERINEIYSEYIVGRYTSFDAEPWPLEERRTWFAKYNNEHGRYRVLVLERSGHVVGFASSGPFRDKAAYDTSVETTIVLAGSVLGEGLGGVLLGALLDEVANANVHRAYALISLPNDPSVALHQRFGYREVGILDEVGHKLDQYHSVLIMERDFLS